VKQLSLAFTYSDYAKLLENRCLFIKQSDLIDYCTTTVLEPALVPGDSVLALEKGEDGLTGVTKILLVKDIISGSPALARNYSCILFT
jgi:hypothetical protein